MTVNRRRLNPTVTHTLTVYAQPDSTLKVACLCGMVVGGRRYVDRTKVTLTDLAELIRLHSQQLDHGQNNDARR